MQVPYAFRVTLLMLLFVAISLYVTAQYRCTLKGTVINRKSTTLILIKKTEDIRFTGQLIPIKNGSFEYTFTYAIPEAYELTFKDESDNGSWRPITFFPYNGSIEMVLHPINEWDKNTVAGGELNTEYTGYLKNSEQKFKLIRDDIDKREDAMRDANSYYSPVMDSILNSLSHEKSQVLRAPLFKKRDSLQKTGNHLSEKGKLLQMENDSLNYKILLHRYAFIASHIDIAGFFLLEEDVLFRKDQPHTIENIQKQYPAFAAKFPNHPYTAFVGNAMRGYLHLAPGGKVIDFYAPDLQGKEHRITDLVKGRVTLLDFWGSWCGSCIANSKLMMPVYQDFKDKGFQVIGIAREYKNTKALNIALKRDKYPWLNLLELDDCHAIWNKYAISNQGGMIILLDKDGQILAIDPSANQVRAALAKVL